MPTMSGAPLGEDVDRVWREQPSPGPADVGCGSAGCEVHGEA